jgi:hypothetical protein
MALEEIRDIVAETPPQTEWGVAVISGEGVDVFGIAPDHEFPAASLGKLGIAHVLTAVEGRIGSACRYEELVVTDEDKRGGSGILQYFPNGYTITPEEAASLMLRESDNTAARLLVKALGGAEAVNDRLAESPLDLALTRLGIRDEDRFTFGSTSPAEVARILLELSKGPLSNALHESDMWYGLCRDIESKPRIPSSLLNKFLLRAGGHEGGGHPRIYKRALNRHYHHSQFARKGGSLEDARHDSAVINGYAVAALSSGYPPDLAYGKRHPAHDIHARIGTAVLSHT